MSRTNPVVQRITQRRHEIAQIIKDKQAEIDFLRSEDKTLENLVKTTDAPAQSVEKAPSKPRGRRKAAQATDVPPTGSTGTPEAPGPIQCPSCGEAFSEWLDKHGVNVCPQCGEPEP